MASADHLLCPITHDLFVDPIGVPCCGQTFSRAALVQHFSLRHDCPMCRSDLSTSFDATLARTNVVIAGLVDHARQQLTPSPSSTVATSISIPAAPRPVPQWSATWRQAVSGERLLSVHLEHASRLLLKPTLFVAVCDVSGSMRGIPSEQVKRSILHMAGLSRVSGEAVELALIAYSDDAVVHDVSLLTPTNVGQIFTLQGTNFGAAFSKIGDVLRTRRHGVYSGAVIAFLTDGQSGAETDSARSNLTDKLKGALLEWKHDVMVHAIGFGQQCDKDLLERIRVSGTTPGVFRYCSPEEDADTLSLKITQLFDEVQRASTLDMTLDGGKVVKMPIDPQCNRGLYQEWVSLVTPRSPSSSSSSTTETVTISLTLPPATEPIILIPTLGAPVSNKEWTAHRLDILAQHVLELEKDKGEEYHLRQLPYDLSVLRQQIRRQMLYVDTESPSQTEALHFLEQQLTAIEAKRKVDVGHLQDMRFSSRFALVQPSLTTQKRDKAHGGDKGRDLEIREQAPTTPLALDQVAYHESPLKRYSRNNVGKQRNRLQEAIMSTSGPRLLACHMAWVESDEKDTTVDTPDKDGNTAFHLAAYCGQDETLKALLEASPTSPAINAPNDDGETPFTLAVKKRGFNRTLTHLLANKSCQWPTVRLRSLHRWAIDKAFHRTAHLLNDLMSSGGVSVEHLTVASAANMSEVYLRHLYQQQRDDPQLSFAEIAMSKCPCLFDVAETVMIHHKRVPTLDQVFQWCFPLKPDAADTPAYLAFLIVCLRLNPSLLTEATVITKETLLFRAVEKGSLAHVLHLLTHQNTKVDARNELGNTPLWLACAKKYPCIVEALLDHGADPNALNDKGNPPMYATCQVGPAKVAELLISRGADIQMVNGNGDTLVLSACRNGQTEILNVLLRYVSLAFVNKPAHIDGFNALLAATEANRPACLESLLTFGMDINQRTGLDNTILKDATPLHLAAYYNRVEAATTLLRRGAMVDIEGGGSDLTPLQIATIQGNEAIMSLLVTAGASKEKALMYCPPDNVGMKALLSDPLLIDCPEKLTRYWHPFLNTIDVKDEDGNTPLIRAVLVSAPPATLSTLMMLGSHSSLINRFGMSAIHYATWSRHERILELLHVPASLTDALVLQRLRQAATTGGHLASRVLHLTPLSPLSSSSLRSSLEQRMTIVKQQGDSFTDATPPPLSPVTTDVVKYNSQLAWPSSSVLEQAKLQTVNQVASGSSIPVLDLFTVALYPFVPQVDRMRFHATYLRRALTSYPVAVGEIFIQSPFRLPEDERLHLVAPVSGSTLWRLATKQFRVKTDTLGIFKCRTARFIGGASCEAIVSPGVYRLVARYQYDPICCGQANIREHTYRVKPNDVIRSLVYVFEEEEEEEEVGKRDQKQLGVNVTATSLDIEKENPK